MSTQPPNPVPPRNPDYPPRQPNRGDGGGWGWGWWIVFLLVIIGIACWWGWGGGWGGGRYPANNTYHTAPAPVNQPTANRPVPANSAQSAAYHEGPENNAGPATRP